MAPSPRRAMQPTTIGRAEERGRVASAGARAPRRGVSMIELVITLAILGVLSAIAVPRVAQSAERNRLENIERSATRAIAFARSEARRRSANVVVRFNAGDEVIDIHATVAGSPVAVAWRGDPAGSGATRDAVVRWRVAIDPHGRAAMIGTPAGLDADHVLSVTAVSAGGG